MGEASGAPRPAGAATAGVSGVSAPLVATQGHIAATTEIAVIGAGVVAHAVAVRLAQAGHEVTMVAPGELGDGASYGNAGVIADYAVLPIGTPAVLRALPSLLFDRNSPLAIRRAALLSLAPWLLRFLGQSLPGPAHRNARAIAALLAPSPDEWRGLAADIGATDLLRQRGALHLYETPRQHAAAAGERAWRKAMGVNMEPVAAHEIAQLEPGLRGVPLAGAVLFPDTLSVTDPGEMLRHLALAAEALGVARIVGRAEALRRRGGGVEIGGVQTGGVQTGGAGFGLRAARAVVAAGAHSRPLALAAGDRVPLDTERGYHLEFDMADLPVTRPATPTGRGFYFSPMQGRLRVAGTVELGGLGAPPSPHRLARLEEGARALLPDLPPPDRTWMGFRPSVPDSVPVIGPSRGGDEILFAFGHGHLGLTLAPITARIIAALVAGKPPPLPLEPYLSSRF